VAIEENAELVIFGTGASEIDGSNRRLWSGVFECCHYLLLCTGVKEGQYSLDFLMNNFDKLTEFTEFQSWSKLKLAKARAIMAVIGRAEIQSQNTVQEVTGNLIQSESCVVMDITAEADRTDSSAVVDAQRPESSSWRQSVPKLFWCPAQPTSLVA
jgi:hypothetical protein